MSSHELSARPNLDKGKEINLKKSLSIGKKSGVASMQMNPEESRINTNNHEITQEIYKAKPLTSHVSKRIIKPRIYGSGSVDKIKNFTLLPRKWTNSSNQPGVIESQQTFENTNEALVSLTTFSNTYDQDLKQNKVNKIYNKITKQDRSNQLKNVYKQQKIPRKNKSNQKIQDLKNEII